MKTHKAIFLCKHWRYILFLLLSGSNLYPADSINVNSADIRFDINIYGSLTTTGKNVQFQGELDVGYRFLNYCAVSVSFNVQRRNGLLCTSDYLALYGVTRFKQVLLKGGATGGIYTIRSGVYRDIAPAAGAEFVIAYLLTEHISILFKERITAQFMENNHVVATNSLLGLGLLF